MISAIYWEEPVFSMKRYPCKSSLYSREVCVYGEGGLIMKKILLAALSGLLALAMVFALVGCSKSNEQLIKEDMAKVLDDFKSQLSSPESALWSGSMHDMASMADAMGISLKDLSTAWSDGLTYEIGKVNVEGSIAVVEVIITSKKLAPAISGADAMLKSDPATAQMSPADKQKKFGELTISELRKSTPKSTTVMIPYIKTDKTWSRPPDAMAYLASALQE